MQMDFGSVQYLCGEAGDYADMPRLRALQPFSDAVCGFLNELSTMIMKDPAAREFPDVMTFGFFCRKANIAALKKRYKGAAENRLGRGVTFHIAPSNVPVNFAYSLVAALLAGNSCIVRASSKAFPQLDILCRAISAVAAQEQHRALADYICVVRYPHSQTVTDAFSAIADVRIIWGGDATVAAVRRSPIPPRATELTFADRYSIAVIDAQSYLTDNEKEKTAQAFYNDTYLYDQNACTSPRLIYWVGAPEAIEAAASLFWENLHRLLLQKYRLEPVIAVDKYVAACRIAIQLGGRLRSMPDNLISRVHIDKLTTDLYDFRCAGGSFIEYGDESLDALANIVTRKYQTLSFIGIGREKLANFVMENGLHGIDRIVPVGKTADFDLIWDGYDLIRQMSRIVAL